MMNSWTRPSGSPINLPDDVDESFLNPVQLQDELVLFDSQDFSNSQVPYLGEGEEQSSLLEIFTQQSNAQATGNHYEEFILNPTPDDPILKLCCSQDSSASQSLLSQGQMKYLEGEFKGLSDVSFEDLQETGDLATIAGPSYAQYCDGFAPSQKRLMLKEERFEQKPLSQEVIEINSWPGRYNFIVKPTNGGNQKKCIFWAEKNKLYVARDYHIPFKFSMDYNNMGDTSEFTISTMLVFTDSQYREIPVLRCLVCKEKEKSSINPDRVSHIVRCQQPQAEYLTKNERRHVTCKVRKPQPGGDTPSTNFMFTCLSSCKSGESGREGGIQRRTTAIVFNLLDKDNKICGRDVFGVRICSAPLRDINKDRQDEVNNQKKTKKRKSVPQSGTPKVPKIQAPVSTVTLSTLEDDNKPTSSSQETCYSDEESETQHTIKLRSLMKSVKWALTYKHSENRLLKAKAKEVFSSVKMTSVLVANMKELAEDVEIVGNPKGSPDQGCQDLD